MGKLLEKYFKRRIQMFKTKFKVSIILSTIIILLAVIASAGGLFMEILYRDNAYVKTAWCGNDIVTLFKHFQ